VADELLELLTICHEAEDDGPALERLCAALRERLCAASVCVFGDEAAGRLLSVGQPRGPSAETARRAVATGQLVPAAVVCDGWEAAAPVRYGGQTIGALTCRWPVDATLDPRRVDRLLATAAAACAPSLRVALERRVVPPATRDDDLGLVGSSAAMAQVRQAIRKAASVPFQILIEGESGSGKELVARAVHRAGPRRQRRLCAINCAALPDELLEAELFGHSRGAFTGAVAERAGVFEEADGGTLFLDEVSELSPRAQAKLLRVLQESEVRRIGEGLPRRIDVRIIAATNRSLAREADGGRFRADLRYRLEVVRIVVPPLRERREDIPLLAARFWADCSSRAGSRAVLDRTAIDALVRHDWPGNVRELQNALAALAVHAPRRGRVVAHDLPPALRGGAWLPVSTLDEARRAFEISFVREALHRAGGRRAAVARELGLTRQGLSKLMVRLGLADERGACGRVGATGAGAAPRSGGDPGAGA
jgi:DNA-binding NtrC family response regulator